MADLAMRYDYDSDVVIFRSSDRVGRAGRSPSRPGRTSSAAGVTRLEKKLARRRTRSAAALGALLIEQASRPQAEREHAERLTQRRSCSAAPICTAERAGGERSMRRSAD